LHHVAFEEKWEAMMSSEMILTPIVDQLRVVTDKVAMVRDLVLEHGGFWQDPENQTGLFEIQLAGLAGIGPSAAAAVEDWLAQAMTFLSGHQEEAY
jgi:hypothetical protein